MWNGPVGLGAKRTFMELMIIPLLHIQKTTALCSNAFRGAQWHLAFQFVVALILIRSNGISKTDCKLAFNRINDVV